jgi:hypothetical protein
MGSIEFDPFNGSFDGRVLVSQKIRMRVVGVYRRAEQNDDRYRWPHTSHVGPLCEQYAMASPSLPEEFLTSCSETHVSPGRLTRGRWMRCAMR